jgi:rSAM/selenodomain-associated transferase 2
LWKRLLPVAITVLALAMVLRQLDLAELGRVLGRLHPGWFAGAVACVGTACLLASWRWHLMLRLTGGVVHAGASVRLFFIGHFFNLVLLGAAGGDFAKSLLYCRWFRTPLPGVLASCPVDRTLGVAGMVLFAAAAFGLAALQGGFNEGAESWIRLPFGWLAFAGLLALVGLLLILRWRPRSNAALAQAWNVFANGMVRLMASPRKAAPGLALSVVVHLCTAVTLGLCLLSVTRADVPWIALAWTFPVISVMATLPSIGGLGVRDGAALALLQLYGVPPADAVAASLLTMCANLVWGGVGAGLLAREEKRIQSPVVRTAAAREFGRLSVVIPTRNEAAELPETIRRARAVPEVAEIIVVDGGSTDSTRELAAAGGCTVLTTEPGRGRQLRLGAARATGDVVVLLHADTWLPPEAGGAVRDCLRDAAVVGGGFWKVFREPSVFMLGSRWRCAARLFVGGRFVGDQAMFVRRDALERIGGVPDMPLMEEFELCRRLRRLGRLALAPATVSTSSRRFTRLGPLRTYLRMWRVAAQYRLGTPPRRLQEIYERD